VSVAGVVKKRGIYRTWKALRYLSDRPDASWTFLRDSQWSGSEKVLYFCGWSHRKHDFFILWARLNVL